MKLTPKIFQVKIKLTKQNSFIRFINFVTVLIYDFVAVLINEFGMNCNHAVATFKKTLKDQSLQVLNVFCAKDHCFKADSMVTQLLYKYCM